MFRVAIAAAVVGIALAFVDSARSDEIPLFNVHVDKFEANAGWQGGDVQVALNANDYAITKLSETAPPPHQVYSDISVCVELPTRTICSNSGLLDNQFEVNGNLASATVKADLPAQECLRVAPYGCSDARLQIDLVWNAIGPLDRSESFHNKIFFDACHINEVGTITRRQAQVTGSITDGPVNFLAGLNTSYEEVSRFRSADTGRGDGEICL